jgi:hypothetical protein
METVATSTVAGSTLTRIIDWVSTASEANFLSSSLPRSRILKRRRGRTTPPAMDPKRLDESVVGVDSITATDVAVAVAGETAGTDVLPGGTRVERGWIGGFGREIC